MSNQHTNIVNCVDGFIYESKQGPLYVTVMEHFEGLTFDNFIESYGGRPDMLQAYMKLFKEMVEVTSFIKQYIHFNPSSIQIVLPTSNQLSVKIDIFGLTKEVSENVLYSAPESLKGEHSTASNVWALGVVLFEMVSGQHPFEKSQQSI